MEQNSHSCWDERLYPLLFTSSSSYRVSMKKDRDRDREIEGEGDKQSEGDV